MFRPRNRIFVSILVLNSLAGCTIHSATDTGKGTGGSDANPTDSAGDGGTSSTRGSSAKGGAGSATGGTSDTASVSCELGGPITIDTTWEPQVACPDGYDVTDIVTVSGAGTSLVIKAGTKLKFASGTNLEILASASLVAVGTSDNPITFTGWQKLAGAWGGIIFRSSALENEISHAVVEYGGEVDNTSGAVVLSYGVQTARLKLSNARIRESAGFGLTVYSGAVLTQLENNTISKNTKGAIRVDVPSVHQLRGAGNSIVDNGEGNTISIEASVSNPISDSDVSWPNLYPAIYRVGNTTSNNDAQITVRKHLTIDPGTVFEFVGGSGIWVDGGAAGLSAVGTPAAPIVFRGVGGSSWNGIGIYESAWSGNALEEVRIENASGPVYDSLIFVAGKRSAVAVSQIMDQDAARLRIKNLSISGPNNAETDILVNTPAMLTQEGTNTGSGPNGVLAVDTF